MVLFLFMGKNPVIEGTGPGPSSSMMGIYPIREKSPIDQMGKKYMGKINGIFHHRINLSQWYKLQ